MLAQEHFKNQRSHNEGESLNKFAWFNYFGFKNYLHVFTMFIKKENDTSTHLTFINKISVCYLRKRLINLNFLNFLYWFTDQIR